MADHDDGISARRFVFFGDKGAALESGNAEHIEVVSRNDFAPDLFDFVGAAQFELANAVRGESGEDFVAFTKVDVTRIGSPCLRCRARRVAPVRRLHADAAAANLRC